MKDESKKKKPFIHKEMTDEERKKWLENREKAIDTQGRAKLWNYFIEITRSRPFKDKIKAIQEKIKHPKRDFEWEKDDIKETLNIILKTNKKPSKKELEQISKQIREDEDTVHKILWGEIREICKTYYLHPLYWGFIIKEIIKGKEPEPETDFGFDLCLFLDQREENEEYELEKAEGSASDTPQNDDWAFPLAIRISPYASENDIVDFVKKIYAHSIKPAQESYLDENIKIGKIKKKKVQERNDFIFEIHRDGDKFTPYREMQSMIREKFGETLDLSYIAKIIATERKKRKEL